MKRSREVLIGDVLKEFFERPYIAARIAEGKLPEIWREVVGDHIADMTLELRIEKHILHVKVESSLIKQELFYQRDALRDQINSHAGVKFVNAVIIR